MAWQVAALPAARARLGLVALLGGLAVLAWWSTVRSMDGMDTGPSTDLGALGWFAGIWIVMMAAMMLPAVSPTVALYAGLTRRRGSSLAFVFVSGYLVVWGLAGLVAYGIFVIARGGFGSQLAWHASGRWVSGGILVAAAVYELTPLKDICLGKCRSPVGFLLAAWRDGVRGAFEMGAKHALWCVGCCWALMAALFALGVMSILWMAVVAGLITVEKLLPWRGVAVWSTAALLLALAIGVLAVPRSIPGFVVPSSSGGSMMTQ